MKICEVITEPADATEQLPTTVGEYISHYHLQPSAFTALAFSKPNAIRSFDGTPSMLYSLDITNTHILTLDGLNMVYCTNLILCESAVHIKSCRQIHQHVKRMDYVHVDSSTTNLLGLLNCVNPVFSGGVAERIVCWKGNERDEPLTKLMNELLQLDDIHEAQERLIAAGYPQQARI